MVSDSALHLFLSEYRVTIHRTRECIWVYSVLTQVRNIPSKWCIFNDHIICYIFLLLLLDCGVAFFFFNSLLAW